jgi:YVTN family beta-propeller protein
MGYARYIGRVGALAVALGIGVALANGPATAWADGDDGASSGSTSAESSSSTDAGGASTGDTSGDAPGPASGSSLGDSSDDGSTGDDASDGDSNGEDDAAGEDDAKVGSESDGKPTGEEAELTENLEPTGVEQPATSPPKKPKAERKSSGGSQRQAAPTQNSDNKSGSTVSADSTATASPGTGTDSGPATADTSIATLSVQPTDTAVATDVSAPLATDVATASTATEAPAEATAGVLSWLSLNPLLDGGPADVPDSPVAWAVFAALRRRTAEDTGTEQQLLSVVDPVVSTLSVEEEPASMMAMAAAVNAGPSASPTAGAPDTVTGKVTGSLNAVDPEGNPLTYTVQSKTAGATVSVDGSGSFTYTPSGAMRAQAATTLGLDNDTFTVRVSDGQTFTDVPVTATVRPSQLAPGAAVDVGRDPSGVAFSVDGSRAYVTNQYDKTVSVINASNGAVLATIAVPYAPTAVVVSPAADKNLAYVAMSTGVAVIDTATNKVADLKPSTPTVDVITVGSSPSAIAINPLGTRLYVSNGGSSTVSVVDTVTNLEITKVSVGSQPSGLAVSADGTKVYALSRATNKVTVFSTANNQVIGSAAVGASPRGIVLSSDGQVGYVTNYTSGTVTVLNTSAPTPVFTKTLTVGTQPEGVAMSKDGSLVYVANGRDTVSVINTATNTVIGSAVPIGGTGTSGAHAIAVSGNTMYVTDHVEDWVRVLNVVPVQSPPAISTPIVSAPNLVTGTVSGSFTATDDDALQHTNTQGLKGTVVVNSGPYQAGVTAFNFTYTPTQAAREQAAQTPGPDFDSFTVTLSDGLTSTARLITVTVQPTGSQNSAIPVGQLPTDVAVSGSHAYVANLADNSVSVIDTSTNAVTKTIPVGGPPIRIVSSPTSSHVYVATANNAVSVIDTNSQTVVATIGVPTGQRGGLADMEVSPDGMEVYVTAWGGTVSVINTTTRTVSGPYTVGPAARGVAVSPDGSRLYVSTELWNSNVIVVDANSMTVITTIDVGEMSYPLDGAFTPDGKRLYLLTGAQGSETAESALMVIDTDRTSATYNSVIRTIYAYELQSWSPADVVFSPDGSKAYVSDAGGNTITVIDTGTISVIGTITTGLSSSSGSRRLAISPDGETLYVTDQASNVVRVVAADSVVAV